MLVLLAAAAIIVLGIILAWFLLTSFAAPFALGLMLALALILLPAVLVWFLRITGIYDTVHWSRKRGARP